MRATCAAATASRVATAEVPTAAAAEMLLHASVRSTTCIIDRRHSRDGDVRSLRRGERGRLCIFAIRIYVMLKKNGRFARSATATARRASTVSVSLSVLQFDQSTVFNVFKKNQKSDQTQAYRTARLCATRATCAAATTRPVGAPVRVLVSSPAVFSRNSFSFPRLRARTKPRYLAAQRLRRHTKLALALRRLRQLSSGNHFQRLQNDKR